MSRRSRSRRRPPGPALTYDPVAAGEIEAPGVHTPTGSVTDHGERAAVEACVHTLSTKTGVDAAFWRQALERAQGNVNQYFAAGYSGEQAIAQQLLGLAMLCHDAQWDHPKISRVVGNHLPLYYDCVGKIVDAAGKSVERRMRDGGFILPVH